MDLPPRDEFEGWDQAQVALFLCKNKMQDCAATVHRLNINGQRFLNLSDSDISKFSLIHQPQLQKIVQDIKKNDSSFLNKLRRLKTKPLPKVPVRDYRDDDHLSEPEYDNDTYEDPREDQDDSYEPPPSHRAFSTTAPALLPRGDYLDNNFKPPQRPPKKPLRPAKGSKQLPPEPNHMGSDEEDYINPDDNYVEPAENPTSDHMMHGGSRAGRDRHMLPKSSPECPPRSEFYEVPDTENNSLSLPASRLCAVPTTQSHSLPPIPSPRLKAMKSAFTVWGAAGNDEYEVCDAENSMSDKDTEGPPVHAPKPLPRERSPKPPIKPRPDWKPREFESRTLPPMIQNEPKLLQKTLTLDLQRPKIPLPQFTLAQADDRRRGSVDTDLVEQDMDADVHNKSWYAGACDRKTADDVLLRANKDGAFMVRKSSGHDAQQPYTLVVFYKDRVYNIPVRFIPTTQQYALGREKKGEEYFSSVCHIIESHQRNHLVLIDSQSNTKDMTKLSYPTRPPPH